VFEAAKEEIKNFIDFLFSPYRTIFHWWWLTSDVLGFLYACGLGAFFAIV